MAFVQPIKAKRMLGYHAPRVSRQVPPRRAVYHKIFACFLYGREVPGESMLSAETGLEAFSDWLQIVRLG